MSLESSDLSRYHFSFAMTQAYRHHTGTPKVLTLIQRHFVIHTSRSADQTMIDDEILTIRELCGWL